jgi:hypothetical protein
MSYQIVFALTPADDLELQDRKQEIMRVLREHKCEVTFTKVDGSVRVMPCTLSNDFLPPAPTPVVESSENVRKINPNTLSAYCLDKNEWRSFRIANVTEIKILE